LARHGVRAATILVCVALAATLAFACCTLLSRPLENTEGSLLFEASRVRAGLPLFTDPARGAFDYGPVPARYHVLYPPLWSCALAAVPERAAAGLGRAISGLAWYGVLAWIAWGARRRGRPAGVLMAAFAGGIYTLALYGASARPDGVATAIAAIALERSVRAGRAGPTEGGLFAVAAWLKPNVLGLGAGAMASQLLAPVRALMGFTGVSAIVAAVLDRASGGAVWHHVVAATWQPPSLTLWLDQMRTRAPFFAGPIAFALFTGARGRAEPGVRIATLALATSAAWTLLSLSKVGSATCYWMEPCLGAAVLYAHAPLPALSSRWRGALAVALPLQALYTGVASVRSSVEAILESPAKARLLGELRAALAPGQLLLSDDAGVELALDGRLVDTPFQTTALVRAGRFPERAWISDVNQEAVVGVVATSDLLERPLGDVDPVNDRYDVALRRALRARFSLARREAGFFIYAARP
jgi:hypothetical protein